MLNSLFEASYINNEKVMYKYTPRKYILHEMQVKRTGRWWDTEFSKRKEILKRFHIDDYAYYNALSRYYPKIKFFSKVKVKHVPVNGYLFPVEMFNEEAL